MANPITLIGDLAALAKAGFTANDIKDMMAKEEAPQQEVEKPAEISPKAEQQPDQEKTEKEETPEPDYKKMYEDLKAKQEQTEKDLKAAQSFNSSKPVQTEVKSAQDKLNEMYLNLIS